MENPLEGLIETWTKADGTAVRIGDMTPSHLRNAIKQLTRDPAVMKALVTLRLTIELARRTEDVVEQRHHDEWIALMAQEMAFGSGS